MCYVVQVVGPLERVSFWTRNTHVFKGKVMCFVVQVVGPLESVLSIWTRKHMFLEAMS